MCPGCAAATSGRALESIGQAKWLAETACYNQGFPGDP